MKNSLKVATGFLLAFALLYDSLNFSLYKTIVIFICIFIMSLLKFNFKKNKSYYNNLIMMCALALAYSLFIETYFSSIFAVFYSFSFHFYIIYILYLLFPVVYCVILTWYIKQYTGTSKESLNLPELYPEREKDLKRLYNAFIKYSLIGVVSDWGSGKTLLTQYLEKEVHKNYKDKWAFIRFNILSCKLDDIEYTIIDEIENILDGHHIASKHTRKLKSLLASNEIFKGIYSYIFPSEPYSKAIENLKKQMVSYDIHIAIIVEDIDRVNNSNSVDKLISITNALQEGAGENIKIIYEYNSAKLFELNPKFNREFLDKYVSYEVFVTPVKITNLVNRIIKNNSFKNIKEDDFIFLDLPTKISEFNQNFGISFEARIKNLDYPIRRVEHFLESIENYLFELNIRDQALRDKYVRVVIVFFFIKNFDHNFFNRLESFNNVFDSFYFIEKNENGDKENIKGIDALLSEYYSIDSIQETDTLIKEKTYSLIDLKV